MTMASSISKTECRWSGCKDPGPFVSVEALVDHVHHGHLNQFNNEDFVVCLWQGCKVYNRPFEKKDWLPQHMRRHTNERPHKCFMNGCNVSFWNVHALQNHLQLHFRQSAVKQKNKTPSHNCICPPSSSSISPSPKTTVSVNEEPDKSSAHKKRHLPLNIHIPLHSKAKLSILDSCSHIPVPINGSIVHDDNIDLSTLSVIKKTLFKHILIGSHRTTIKDSISLNGKIIGKRHYQTITEYLICWSPKLVPDSWVPVSDYTGHRTVALSDLKDCQKSCLVQCRFLTARRNIKCGRKRKRK